MHVGWSNMRGPLCAGCSCKMQLSLALWTPMCIEYNKKYRASDMAHDDHKHMHEAGQGQYCTVRHPNLMSQLVTHTASVP